MAKPSTRAARFWKRLAQNYGAKLAEEYGPNPPEDWCAVIDRTDDERLNKALVAIRSQNPNWPPTLGQFEVAIPRRELQRGEAITDRLAAQGANLSLCEHQRMAKWNYFGRHDGRDVEIRGAVVPACSPCGRQSHRIRVEDLTERAV